MELSEYDNLQKRTKEIFKTEGLTVHINRNIQSTCSLLYSLNAFNFT